MSLSLGRNLAHYRIDRKIGEGGMGEVWGETEQASVTLVQGWRNLVEGR